jgi:hypothetical protein
MNFAQRKQDRIAAGHTQNVFDVCVAVDYNTAHVLSTFRSRKEAQLFIDDQCSALVSDTRARRAAEETFGYGRSFHFYVRTRGAAA